MTWTVMKALIAAVLVWHAQVDGLRIMRVKMDKMINSVHQSENTDSDCVCKTDNSDTQNQSADAQTPVTVLELGAFFNICCSGSSDSRFANARSGHNAGAQRQPQSLMSSGRDAGEAVLRRREARRRQEEEEAAERQYWQDNLSEIQPPSLVNRMVVVPQHDPAAGAEESISGMYGSESAGGFSTAISSRASGRLGAGRGLPENAENLFG